MQNNRLYECLQKQQDSVKKHYILSPSNGYFCLSPKNRKTIQINTKLGRLTVNNYHISVFNVIEIQDSTFHITFDLSNEHKNSYIVRIYYKGMGEHIFQTCEDSHQNSADMGESQPLMQFGTARVGEFINMISQFKRHFEDEYKRCDVAISLLNNGALSDFSSEKLQSYKIALEKVIAHIHSEPLFNATYQDKLRFYKNNLNMVNEQIERNLKTPKAKKPAQAPVDVSKNTAIKTPEKPVKNPPPKKKAATKALSKSSTNSKLSSNKDPLIALNAQINSISDKKNKTPADLSKEYQLLQKKLTLIDSDDDACLDISMHIATLGREINTLFTKNLSDLVHYGEPVIINILKQSSLSTEELLELAVTKACVPILEAVKKARTNINFDKKGTLSDKFLLEIASDTHENVFYFLLVNKASPNIICRNQMTLLNNFCAKDTDNINAIVALLKAGADPRIIDALGLNALGHLIVNYMMQENMDLGKIKRFLEHTVAYPEIINQLQGPNKETILSAVCRKQKPALPPRELIKLLLEYDANPNIFCDSIPKSTALGECVLRNNKELLEIIINHSKCILTKATLCDALNKAVIKQSEHLEWFTKKIIEYGSQHGLTLTIPTKAEAEKQENKSTVPLQDRLLGIARVMQGGHGLFGNCPFSKKDIEEIGSDKVYPK